MALSGRSDEEERAYALLLEALRLLDAAGLTIPAAHVATALSSLGYEVPSLPVQGDDADQIGGNSAFGQLDKGQQR